MRAVDIAQGVYGYHHAYAAEHEQKQFCRGRGGHGQHRGQGQGGEGRAGLGGPGQPGQKSQAGEEGAQIITPVGRMHGAVRGRKAAGGQEVRQRAAPKAQQGHGTGQQQRRQTAGAWRTCAGSGFGRGFQHRYAHGRHIQPDKDRGGEGRRQQDRQAAGQVVQHAGRYEGAGFRHKEGRAAHGGQQAQGKGRACPGSARAHAAQVFQAQGRGGVGPDGPVLQTAQGRPGQQA